MSVLEFLDTNVLVYDFDNAAGSKHQAARALTRELRTHGRGAISTQVLQELYSVITGRKLPHPADHGTARVHLHRFDSWTVVPVQVKTVHAASELAEAYKVNFWDGLILAAAGECSASIVWTEDLSHGQRHGSVEVRNPFV